MIHNTYLIKEDWGYKTPQEELERMKKGHPKLGQKRKIKKSPPVFKKMERKYKIYRGILASLYFFNRPLKHIPLLSDFSA